MRDRWIQEHRDTFPVTMMCRVLRVSRSSDDDWLRRPPSPRAVRTEKIREGVREVFEQSERLFFVDILHIEIRRRVGV